MTLKLSSDDILILKRLVREVGQDLLSTQGSVQLLRTKENNTPETDADLHADLKISEKLREHFGDIPVLSEEGVIPPFEVRKEWSQFWLVDPLDGTKEYIQGRPDFTVNIALVKGQTPVFGVVYAPGLDELYWGVTLNDRYQAFKESQGKKFQIFSSEQVCFGDNISIVESRSHPSKQLESFLARFKVEKRLQIGSSLKICRLAEGEVSLYPRLGPTMEWDIAAADAIYRASGRAAPNFSPLLYNKESLLNPFFAMGLCDTEKQPHE